VFPSDVEHEPLRPCDLAIDAVVLRGLAVARFDDREAPANPRIDVHATRHASNAVSAAAA
jgi:hypothetical protein